MKISQQSLGISVLLTFTLFFFSMKITSQLSWRITITSLTPCLEMDQSETGKINHRAENSIMEGWQVGSTRPDIQLATVSPSSQLCMFSSSFVFFSFCVRHPSIVLLYNWDDAGGVTGGHAGGVYLYLYMSHGFAPGKPLDLNLSQLSAHFSSCLKLWQVVKCNCASGGFHVCQRGFTRTFVKKTALTLAKCNGGMMTMVGAFDWIRKITTMSTRWWLSTV